LSQSPPATDSTYQGRPAPVTHGYRKLTIFSGTPTDAAFWFGGVPANSSFPGDKPVVGKWGGENTAKVGLVRPYAPGLVSQSQPYYWVPDTARTWETQTSHQPDTAKCFAFGGSVGDVFVTGDWNSVGTTAAGVYNSGTWSLDQALPGQVQALHDDPPMTLSFGSPTSNVPITGYWGKMQVTVLTSALTSAQVGASYQQLLNAAGGPGGPPYAWSIIGGSLPSGLSLSTVNLNGNPQAAITGMPTAAGSFPVTLQVSDGLSPAVSRSFTLVVNPPPDFTLSTSTTSISLVPGGSAMVTATVQSSNGFAGTVFLHCDYLGLKVTVGGSNACATTGTPVTLDPFTNPSATVTFSVEAGSNAAAAAYPITIRATSATLMHSQMFQANVVDFTISNPSPSSVTVTPAGAQGSYNQTFQGLNGFSSGVTLSYSGAGSLVFTPKSLVISGSSPIGQTFTVIAPASTASQTYNVQITASFKDANGTPHSHTSSIVVKVTQPNFSIDSVPEITLSTDQSWVYFSQRIKGTDGFNSAVTITNYQYRDANGVHATQGGPVFLQYGAPSWSVDAASAQVIATGGIEASSRYATPGVYYYDCVAQSGSLTPQYFSITVNLQAPSLPIDFSFTSGANVVPITVSAGGAPSVYQDAVTPLNATNAANWSGVATSTGWPSGVSAVITPATFSGLPTVLNISITASPAAVPASTNATVTVTVTNTATGQTVSHNIPIALTVTNGPTFTLTASPTSQSANAQGMASYRVHLNPINGYNRRVTFGANVPAGSSASFNPSVLNNGSGSTTMTVYSPPALSAKTLSLTAIGTGDDGSSASVPLTVSPNLISGPAGGAIEYPANGGTIYDCSPVFVWSTGTGVSEYELFAGTAPRGQSDSANIFSVSHLPTTKNYLQFPLQNHAGTIYVTLVSIIDGTSVYNDESFTSACGDPSLPGYHPKPSYAVPFASQVTLLNDSSSRGSQDEWDYNYTTDPDGDPQFFSGCYANRSGNPLDTPGDLPLGVSLVARLNSRQFTLGYRVSDNVPAGVYSVFCIWQDPDTNGTPNYIPMQGGVTVYDATPVITGIQQLEPLSPGGSAEVVISGRNFGNKPTQPTFYTCTTGGSNPSGCNVTTEIQLDLTSVAWGPEMIDGSVYIPNPNTVPNSYYVAITSQGVDGTGQNFQQTNPNSTPKGQPKGPIGSSPPTFKFTQFSWIGNEPIYPATTFASNGDNGNVDIYGNTGTRPSLVWDATSSTNRPVVLGAGKSGQAYCAVNIDLSTSPPITAYAKLSATVSPADFSFNTITVNFQNGKTTIDGQQQGTLPYLCIDTTKPLPNAIGKKTYTIEWKITFPFTYPYNQTSAVSFNSTGPHNIYLIHDLPDFTNSPDYRVTLKRLDYVLSQIPSFPDNSLSGTDLIVSNLGINLNQTPGFDPQANIPKNTNPWARMDRPIPVDCLSLAALSAVMLKQLGYSSARSEKAFPTGGNPAGDTNAVLQEFTPDRQYELGFGNVIGPWNEFEGFGLLGSPDLNSDPQPGFWDTQGAR
jgi:hypothetical protein